MERKKIFFFIGILIFLNGCMQSTAMVGPTMTLVSTGNIYQAGLTFGANKAIENETGMTASEHLNKKIKKKNKEKKFEKKLLALIKSNYEKTRKTLLSQYISVN